MAYFPFIEDITDKTFLIIGGGETARRKAEKLKLFTDHVIIMAERSDLDQAIIKRFDETDLENVDYVIGATDDPAFNRFLSILCQEKHIPVNIVDDIELCTFIFPSIIKRGDLLITISTSGKSPLMAKHIRERIEAELPDDIETIIETLYQLKNELKTTLPDQKERAHHLNEALQQLL